MLPLVFYINSIAIEFQPNDNVVNVEIYYKCVKITHKCYYLQSFEVLLNGNLLVRYFQVSVTAYNELSPYCCHLSAFTPGLKYCIRVYSFKRYKRELVLYKPMGLKFIQLFIRWIWTAGENSEG